MDGSNGKIVSLLERIATQMEATHEEIQTLRAELRGEIHELRGDVQVLRRDMRHGFEQVNTRIDNVIAFMGAHHADHEGRIRVLEERVLGKSG